MKLSGEEQFALDLLRDKVTDATAQGDPSEAQQKAQTPSHKRTHANMVGPRGASGPARSGAKVARTGANSKRSEILRRKEQADALEDARMEAFKKAMGLA